MMVTKQLSQVFQSFFFNQISIAPLIVFRIIFGIMLFFGTVRFMINGWVKELYIDPQYHFGYLGFEWVEKLPGNWMYLPFIIMLITSVLISTGLFYRLAIVLFFINFSYIELIDKSYYLNHYYFISLISFLLIWLPANQSFSLDSYRRKMAITHIPAWCINILIFQIAVVYFFAGIAKINNDWLLLGEPLHTWLQAHHQIPILGNLLKERWFAIGLSWIGMLYDIFIVLLLLSKKTRLIGYILVIIFHLFTWYLFPIGIFPWVMILVTLIFFPPRFHSKLLGFFQSLKTNNKDPHINYYPEFITKKSIISFLLFSFILIQITVPMRYLIYPGNLFWNEEGFRFSWRVMLMHKEGNATFYLIDNISGGKTEIDNNQFLTSVQQDQMTTQPDMIIQYAQILSKYYKDKTFEYGGKKVKYENFSVHADVRVSLNGRESQRFIKSDTDLSKVKYNLDHRNWVMPMIK